MITVNHLIEAGIPEFPAIAQIAQIVGRPVASLRTSISNGQLTPSRRGLLEYLNQPRNYRYRRHFKNWLENHANKARYSLHYTPVKLSITVK